MHEAKLVLRESEYYSLSIRGSVTNCLMHVSAHELLDLWQILPQLLDEHPNDDMFLINVANGDFELHRSAIEAIISVAEQWYPDYAAWLHLQAEFGDDAEPVEWPDLQRPMEVTSNI